MDQQIVQRSFTDDSMEYLDCIPAKEALEILPRTVINLANELHFLVGTITDNKEALKVIHSARVPERYGPKDLKRLVTQRWIVSERVGEEVYERMISSSDFLNLLRKKVDTEPGQQTGYANSADKQTQTEDRMLDGGILKEIAERKQKLTDSQANKEQLSKRNPAKRDLSHTNVRKTSILDYLRTAQYWEVENAAKCADPKDWAMEGASKPRDTKETQEGTSEEVKKVGGFSKREMEAASKPRDAEETQDGTLEADKKVGGFSKRVRFECRKCQFRNCNFIERKESRNFHKHWAKYHGKATPQISASSWISQIDFDLALKDWALQHKQAKVLKDAKRKAVKL